MTAEGNGMGSHGIMYNYPDDEKTRALNEPGVLVTNEKELHKGLSEFKEHVERMDEPFRSVYAYYADNTELLQNPLQMSPIGYDPSKDALTYNKAFFKYPQYQQRANIIFSHEYAHVYDFRTVRSWENQNFMSAISDAMQEVSADVEKYKNLYLSLSNLNPAYQDILSALSDNKIKTKFGHDTWDARARAVETFANLSYLQANKIDIPEFDGLLDGVINAFGQMFTGGA